MRRGRLFLIVGGLILTIVLAAGGYLWWSGGGLGLWAPEAGEPDVAPPALRTREVVVAAQDIPRGTRITQESNAVIVQTWLEDSAPETGLDDPTQAYGRIARVEIVRGSPVLERMLTDMPGEISATGSDAALQIPEGRVAYALPIARYSSVAWALQPGDHVDVLISLLMVDVDEEFQTMLPNQAACATQVEGCEDGTLGRLEALPNGWIVNVFPSEGQRPRLVTQLTVQDAVVLRVGDWDKEPEEEPEETPTAEGEGEGAQAEAGAVPRTSEGVKPLTLVVTPQDAAVLKYAEEIGASIDLVLRSAQDSDQEVSTESITLRYLLERFNIEMPPKLPQRTEPPIGTLRSGSAGEAVPLEVEGGRAPQARGGGQAAE